MKQQREWTTGRRGAPGLRGTGTPAGLISQRRPRMAAAAPPSSDPIRASTHTSWKRTLLKWMPPPPTLACGCRRSSNLVKWNAVAYGEATSYEAASPSMAPTCVPRCVALRPGRCRPERSEGGAPSAIAEVRKWPEVGYTSTFPVAGVASRAAYFRGRNGRAG